jgi:hypothetical protein
MVISLLTCCTAAVAATRRLRFRMLAVAAAVWRLPSAAASSVDAGSQSVVRVLS